MRIQAGFSKASLELWSYFRKTQKEGWLLPPGCNATEQSHLMPSGVRPQSIPISQLVGPMRGVPQGLWYWVLHARPGVLFPPAAPENRFQYSEHESWAVILVSLSIAARDWSRVGASLPWEDQESAGLVSDPPSASPCPQRFPAACPFARWLARCWWPCCPASSLQRSMKIIK